MRVQVMSANVAGILQKVRMRVKKKKVRLVVREQGVLSSMSEICLCVTYARVRYVFVSLTRVCAGTKGSAQVVIHKTGGLASDSLVQGLGLGLGLVCEEIRTQVVNWIGSHWEEVADFGDGEVGTLQQVFNTQYPSPQGGKLVIEGRGGQKVVVVKERGHWARLMRLGTTYPDFMFRCAVALCFKVQLIVQHLEPTKDDLCSNFEAYISPVGPTRRVFLFWEQLEEIWYWGHEVEDPCLPGCGGKGLAIKVLFTAPEINTSGDTVSGAPSGKKPRGAPSVPVHLNQGSGPLVTYVRARGYPRPPCSIPVNGACCEEWVWVHLCQGGEADSFFESFAGAFNDYRVGSSMPSKATCTGKSIKRDIRAYIGENKLQVANLFKAFYDDVPEAGMVLRADVSGCEDESLRFKPKDVSFWVSYNMTGNYHHDYIWFIVVANCFNVQFIVVNECGMHPAI